jgi:hypothetical protein
MYEIIQRLYLEEEYELIKKNYNVFIFFLFVYYFAVSMIKSFVNNILYNDYLKNRKKYRLEQPHPNNIHTDLNHSENCKHYLVYDYIYVSDNSSKSIVYCNKCHTTF